MPETYLFINSKEKNIAEITRNLMPEIADKRNIELKFIKYYGVAQQNAPRPVNMSKSQYFNYLAIQLLEELGNDSPSQEMIDFTELFIKRHSRRNKKVDNRCEIK